MRNYRIEPFYFCQQIIDVVKKIEKMKVAIVGTRNEKKISYEEFVGKLEAILKLYEIVPTRIVSGGAKGVDSYARQYANERKLPLTEYLPQYERYGRSAPLVRNTLIVEDADVVIAFPSETSKGTRDSIKKAKDRGKRTYVVGAVSKLAQSHF